MLGVKIRLLVAAGLIVAGLFLAPAGLLSSRAAGDGPIVVIPITGIVDDGMDHLVQRSIAAARYRAISTSIRPCA